MKGGCFLKRARARSELEFWNTILHSSTHFHSDIMIYHYMDPLSSILAKCRSHMIMS